MANPARGDWRDGLPAQASLPAGGRLDLPPVAAVHFDSRDVEPGDLFVCMVGAQADGHAFAAPAVAAGAVALVMEPGRAAALSQLGVPVVEVPDTRRAISSIAAAHEGYPAKRLRVVGVTGTDGKSTTAFLLHAGIESAGEEVGLLSTIEARIGTQPIANPTRLTTQEAPVVQRLLAEMVDAGCTHAVVEATSHGLAMHRLDDCDFDVAVLTNIGEDHLDFHGSLAAYRAAKARLFSMLDEPAERSGDRRAVLNADDPACQEFADATQAPVLTYALDTAADVRARRIELIGVGSTFDVEYDGQTFSAQVRIPGRFNVANALAAIASAIAIGIDPRFASIGIAQCAGVPGRMERVLTSPIGVVVDYAHTGDALERVIRLLRPLTDGRVIVVFGCAGARPRERRTGMGSVVARLADYAILTEEDPRSEDPDAIIDDIAKAVIGSGGTEGVTFERVPDRRAAIARSIEIAEPGDVVLIAGKGHEQTIERADGSHPWDDRRVARELVSERFSDEERM